MSKVVHLDHYRPKPKPPSRLTKSELLHVLALTDDLLAKYRQEQDEQDETLEMYKTQLEETTTTMRALEEELEETQTELQELRDELEDAPTEDELKAAEQEHEDAEQYCEELEDLAIELARIAVDADRQRTLQLLISYNQRIESLDLDHGLPRRLDPAFI